MENSPQQPFKPRPKGHLQTIESIAIALNKSFSGLMIFKTESPAGFERDVQAALSFLDNDELKLLSLRRHKQITLQHLIKSKYWSEARTTDQLAFCVKLVQSWMLKHQKEFSFDVSTFPIDSPFWVPDGEEFWPLDSIKSEIWQYYSTVLDDYAVSYGLSKKIDWLTEKIRLFTETTTKNGELTAKNTTDDQVQSANKKTSIHHNRNSFADYIDKEQRDLLIPFLNIHYKGKGPQQFGFMLYSLHTLNLLPHPTTFIHEDLFRALQQTFDINWTRQALTDNINKLNKGDANKELKIKQHTQKVKDFINQHK